MSGKRGVSIQDYITVNLFPHHGNRFCLQNAVLGASGLYCGSNDVAVLVNNCIAEDVGDVKLLSAN